MEHDRSTEGWQENAALYALGALSQHEARAFEAHLRAGCAACGAQLDEFENVAGTLGLGAAPVSPPARLRAQLISRIAAEPAPGSARGKTAGTQSPPATARRPSLAWAVAAMALLAAALLFAYQRARQQSAAAAQQLAAARSEVERLRAAQEEAQMRVIRLEGQAPAAAEIYWDRRNRKWFVTASLPPPPRGKVYQLWFVTPAANLSAGLIRTDASGRGVSVVDVPADLHDIAAAAITLEPEGGSLQPTMPIYLIGKIA